LLKNDGGGESFIVLVGNRLSKWWGIVYRFSGESFIVQNLQIPENKASKSLQNHPNPF